MPRSVLPLAVAAVALSLGGPIAAQSGSGPGGEAPAIRLERDTPRERETAQALRSLLSAHDVRPWERTDSVLIDERSVPHSHPILTLHTRHLGDDPALLTTYVHEQLHWIEDERREPFEAAMSAFATMYPEVPPRDAGGASDARSTYRHLIVCRLEYEVMSLLVGPAAAREVLERQTHYQWIYDKVLNDDRVQEVTRAHGFTADGARVSR